MTRTLAIGGVPVHPMLVHFPVALWSLVVPIDVLCAAGGSAFWWSAAWYCALGGTLAALPAAVAGILDAVAGRVTVAAENTIWKHTGFMGGAWSAFCLSLLVGPVERADAAFALGAGLHLIGTILLIIGGHAGGHLVHTHHLPASAVTAAISPERTTPQ